MLNNDLISLDLVFKWILPSKHIHMDVVRAIHGYPTEYPSTTITASTYV
jgi:hypothetical protein